MPDPALRLLLLADTHLGFDLPAHPRVERRRRGPDFFANTRLALEPARRGEVDLVVHGGDLLFRARVSDSLVQQAIEPLLEVARLGVPVLLVPGNHERSRLPLSLWTVHPDLHIFRTPAAFTSEVRGLRVAIAGFPCSRRGRDEFSSLLFETRYADSSADVLLLCMHQTVEGATVGIQDYAFRSGPDNIRGRDIPATSPRCSPVISTAPGAAPGPRWPTPRRASGLPRLGGTHCLCRTQGDQRPLPARLRSHRRWPRPAHLMPVRASARPTNDRARPRPHPKDVSRLCREHPLPTGQPGARFCGLPEPGRRPPRAPAVGADRCQPAFAGATHDGRLIPLATRVRRTPHCRGGLNRCSSSGLYL